jgi:hypothetical protein
MSALSLRLPKTLHEQVKELAQEEGISVNRFVMLAVAEKIASISTIEYLVLQRTVRRKTRKNGCTWGCMPPRTPIFSVIFGANAYSNATLRCNVRKACKTGQSRKAAGNSKQSL